MLEQIKKIICLHLANNDLQKDDNYIQIIKLAIENNPVVANLKDQKGDTLLHYIADHVGSGRGGDQFLISLLKCGANPNITDNNGNTPFIRAVISEDIPNAEILAAYGADIFLTNNNGENALLAAASNGQSADNLKQLIKMGLDPFSKNRNGATILHLIFGDYLHKENLYFVKQLIERGLDINAVDNEGNTIWHYYAGNQKLRDIDINFEEHENFSQFLLGYVDINKTNHNNISPLLSSLENSDNLAHSFFIIACGADIPPASIITSRSKKWDDEQAESFLNRIIKVREIADRIYAQKEVHIDNVQLFKHTKFKDMGDAWPTDMLLELRIKNLALKNGMPTDLAQHIMNHVHFDQNLPLHFQNLKEELVKNVINMVKSKNEIGIMIRPLLTDLLNKFSQENRVNKISNAHFIEDYNKNFKSKSSIDYLFNPINRDKIYPILLTDDEKHNELTKIIKNLILYIPDHKLRQEFILDCSAKVLREKTSNLEARLFSETIALLSKRTYTLTGSHTENIVEQRNKIAKASRRDRD